MRLQPGGNQIARRGIFYVSRVHGFIQSQLRMPPTLRPKTPGFGLAFRTAVHRLQRRSAELLRAVVRNIASRFFARLLLRATIARWPTGQEVTRFHQAVRQRHAPLPPLLRGLAGVSAARFHLTQAMLASWMTADEINRGNLLAGLGSRSLAAPGDLLRVWKGPPISFLHLEKTAGTSVSTFLEGLFHPTQIERHPSLGQARGLHVNPHGPRPAFIHGHYDLPTLCRAGPDRFVLTFLREPRARTLSLYYFWRSHTSHEAAKRGVHPGVAEAASCSLLDWLRSSRPEVRNAIDNFYVRRLTGAADQGPGADALAAAPGCRLKDALQALASMEFVGITEQMSASLAVLGRMLEFPPPSVVPEVNVAADNEWGRSSAFKPVWREPITPEIEAELTRLTRLDLVIYHTARTRLANQYNDLVGASAGLGAELGRTIQVA